MIRFSVAGSAVTCQAQGGLSPRGPGACVKLPLPPPSPEMQVVWGIAAGRGKATERKGLPGTVRVSLKNIPLWNRHKGLDGSALHMIWGGFCCAREAPSTTMCQAPLLGSTLYLLSQLCDPNSEYQEGGPCLTVTGGHRVSSFSFCLCHAVE